MNTILPACLTFKVCTNRANSSLPRAAKLAFAVPLICVLAGCATAPGPTDSARTDGISPHRKVGSPYVIQGRTYVPAVDKRYSEIGVASWYGPKFHGKPTANGEMFDMNALTAAHRTLPLPSIAQVTNLENGRKVNVRINDRGPFSKDRIIDLSRAAAKQLGFIEQGTARVKVRYLREADLEVALLRLGDQRAIRDLEKELRNARRVASVDSGTKAVASDDPVSELIARNLADTAPSADNGADNGAGTGVGNGAGTGAGTGADILPTPRGREQRQFPYRIQIGAYSDLNRAEQVRLGLGNNVPVDTDQIRSPTGQRLYRVLAGGFDRESEASAYLRSVQAAGYVHAWVVALRAPRAQY